MKTLIVGLGSIGLRHAHNFRAQGSEIAVCSRRAQPDWTAYSNLEKALREFKPDYVVIANETALHHDTLATVLSIHPDVRSILVEKPLFAEPPSHSFPGTEKVKVAYNLRFHPLTQKLKAVVRDEPLIGWSSYVGQNLEGWRPQRDYRESYSAQKAKGGGVLLDLSHEIDLFQFISGQAEFVTGYGGKFSALEIDSEDTFSLIVKSRRCPHATLHMNYIDRLTQRHLTLHTNSATYALDYIAGTWRDLTGVETLTFDRNESYVGLTKAFLAGSKEVCDFESALTINRIARQAETQSAKGVDS